MNLEVMKRKSYHDGLKSKDNQKKPWWRLPAWHLHWCSRGAEGIRTLGWVVTILTSRVDSSPTHGKFSIKSRKGNAKTPVGTLSLSNVFVFPKTKSRLNVRFPRWKQSRPVAPLNTSLFFKQPREVKPTENGEGGTRKALQRCFINPIKQVDGEGLADNLHLANEACDS